MTGRTLICALAAFAASATFAAAAGPLTAAQYRAKANAACRAFNVKMATVPPPKTKAQYVTFYRAIVRYAPLQIDGIAKARPPASLRAAHMAVLAADRALIARLSALIPKLRSGAITLKQLQSDKTIIAQGTREEAAFKRLGASACL